MDETTEDQEAERMLPPHGTRVRYNRGCSCRLCRVANAEYQAARRWGMTIEQYTAWRKASRMSGSGES